MANFDNDYIFLTLFFILWFFFLQVKQGADAVVNAGKGIVEMGGSVISGLKRGFSKTSEGSGGEWNKWKTKLTKLTNNKTQI